MESIPKSSAQSSVQQSGKKSRSMRSEGSRQDLLVLWAGILFSAAFTGLIWWGGSRLEGVPLLPDQGPSWYYWKLPEPGLWSRLTAWGFYAVHQVAFWGLIYYAQTRQKKYRARLHPVNFWALGVNAFFIGLHFVQTQIWYDGLAQDVSIWSSQASVVLLLVWVLLMENRRRGLFFGNKVPFPRRVVDIARKYHGYYFAWAIVYTFWYHPMVSTSGHLWGFFYMFLLLLQGSLFFTRIHINKYWTFVQEFTVLVHGALVAVMQGNDLWPMFAFGFGGILVITQLYGLGLPAWQRWAVTVGYILSALWVYSGRVWQAFSEIIRIPVIEYILVFLLAGLIALGLGISRRVQRAFQTPEPHAGSESRGVSGRKD